MKDGNWENWQLKYLGLNSYLWFCCQLLIFGAKIQTYFGMKKIQKKIKKFICKKALLIYHFGVKIQIFCRTCGLICNTPFFMIDKITFFASFHFYFFRFPPFCWFFASVQQVIKWKIWASLLVVLPTAVVPDRYYLCGRPNWLVFQTVTGWCCQLLSSHTITRR